MLLVHNVICQKLFGFLAFHKELAQSIFYLGRIKDLFRIYFARCTLKHISFAFSFCVIYIFPGRRQKFNKTSQSSRPVGCVDKYMRELSSAMEISSIT